ncbi:MULTISPECIES: RHS repeat-associated core domain-containing protein, partial [Spirulina sp. CCY15215]|uniref:RHS repeat-associated core domain-containing protein n=1 Tax=Spirulina sp. CCY15215 TaxID=2767591 RepID=UPI00194FD734
FQGQWLESNTDFYHFRARYYDPETGRFVSRDPVDVIETEPESSNPYQFVYNNPHIYSDPTGMFTLVELNSTLNGQDILQTIQIQFRQAAKDYLIDAAKEVVNDIALSALRAYLPFDPKEIWDAVAAITDPVLKRKTAGKEFERRTKKDIREGFDGDQNFLNYIHLEVPISKDGIPQDEGLNIRRFGARSPFSPGVPRPDYLIKPNNPTNMNVDSWLIGDFKMSVKTMIDKYRKNGDQHDQWLAIVNHARLYGKRITGFFTMYPGTSAQNELLRKGGFKRGVVIVILSIKEDNKVKAPLS